MTALPVSSADSLDSYSALQDAITEETDGRANASALARFIRQAEGEIKVFLARNPLRPMRARSDITINAEYVAGPTDMVRPISIEATSDSGKMRVPYVANEALSRMQGKWLFDNRPYAFTREGDDLRFYPVPTTSYVGKLFYFQELPALSSSNQTNWLLTAFPHVYLAGSVYYAYRDMPDIEKASAMKSIFDEALQRLADAYPEPEDEATLSVDPDMLQRRWLWQIV